MRASRLVVPFVAACLLLLLAAAYSTADDLPPEARGATPEAECGPGSRPETGVQGQVTKADRDSGRSEDGYICNLEVLGTHQGTGAGVVSAQYGTCVYQGSFGTGIVGLTPGVQVVDVSDPQNPRHVRTLSSPAMAAGTWETLKVDPVQGRLAAVGTTVLVGPLLFDVYDISEDCTDPQLLNGIAGTNITVPQNVVGHEGGFSPDGDTYYATSSGGGWVTAVDLSDPTRPRTIFAGSTGLTNHGFSFSADGRTMYGVTLIPAGIQVLDVSDIQDRLDSPQIREISTLTWPDGLLSQHTIPIVQDGHEYLVAVDEGGGGSVRIIDIDDPTDPQIVRRIRLQINLPEYQAERQTDISGNGLWGYEAHYCNVDQLPSPTALACGFVQSGIRVFDLRDVRSPREIAYFNPPAVGNSDNLLTIANSPHALAVFAPPAITSDPVTLSNLIGITQPTMTTDWCMSPPWFIGTDQLWSTCSDTGLTTMRFTNAAYPIIDDPVDPDDEGPDADGGDADGGGADGGGADGGGADGDGSGSDVDTDPVAAPSDTSAGQVHGGHGLRSSSLPDGGSDLDRDGLLLALAVTVVGVALVHRARFGRADRTDR